MPWAWDGLQGVADLQHDIQRFGDLQPSPCFDEQGQRLPGQQLHGDIPAVVDFSALDDMDDVRVIEPLGDQRFVLEAFFLVLVVEIFLFQDLEGHDALLVEQVLSLVDRGHAARTDGLQDLEMADMGLFFPKRDGAQVFLQQLPR